MLRFLFNEFLRENFFWKRNNLTKKVRTFPFIFTVLSCSCRVFQLRAGHHHAVQVQIQLTCLSFPQKRNNYTYIHHSIPTNHNHHITLHTAMKSANKDNDSERVRKKKFTGRYSKIDLKEDLDGPTFAVKGERSRKSLISKEKGPQNVIKGGPRGYVEGMDAYTTLTMADIKKEEGWFFKMRPTMWRRTFWRVPMLPIEYEPTIKNPEWRKKQTRMRVFREYIDYFFGLRIKSKYSYHPYRLTFDYLGLNIFQAIRLYWCFARADRDNSGIINQFEWLMHLDVEKTDFNEKVFSIVDFDNSGEMDFREFCMCCWNFASASPIDLINVSFFMYSTDGVLLQANEVLKLINQIWGDKADRSPQARRIKSELLLMVEKYNGIDLSMFGEYCKKHAHLLKPCFEFQRTLRRKCLGHRFWRRLEVSI